MAILTPDSSAWLFDPTYSCINTEKADSYKRKVKVGEDVSPGKKNNNDMSQIMLQWWCLMNPLRPVSLVVVVIQSGIKLIKN